MRRAKELVTALAFATAVATPLWISGGTAPAAPAHADADEHAGSEAAQAPPVAAQPGTRESGDTHVDWRAMDKAMAKRDRSFPARTRGVGAEVMTPKIQADGTRQFDITAAVTKWEVEPGKVVDAWTYNGTVPGPTIHVNVGDKVRLVLHNKLPESTSIHWHGIVVPNDMDGVSDVTQNPVKPGATYTYQFTATRQMVGWYHSHHDGTKQVTSGLFGAFIVGELPLPKGIKVSQELPIELQDAGTVGMTMNGKSFPATKPVRAHLGDWIEVHYINAGTMAHPMHLHGLDQLVIAKDGFPLPAPYKADTINVAPGERYTVLVHADHPGTWAWHCHIFPHSEGAQGMFGLFTEMIVS